MNTIQLDLVLKTGSQLLMSSSQLDLVLLTGSNWTDEYQSVRSGVDNRQPAGLINTSQLDLMLKMGSQSWTHEY